MPITIPTVSTTTTVTQPISANALLVNSAAMKTDPATGKLSAQTVQTPYVAATDSTPAQFASVSDAINISDAQAASANLLTMPAFLLALEALAIETHTYKIARVADVASAQSAVTVANTALATAQAAMATALTAKQASYKAASAANPGNAAAIAADPTYAADHAAYVAAQQAVTTAQAAVAPLQATLKTAQAALADFANPHL